MRIDEISAKNFRKFEDIHIQLQPKINVIAGDNGSGKSSILDALSLGIGSFFLGISRIETPGIKKSDIRYGTYKIGSRIERQPNLPVTISCKGTINEEDLSWSRSLNTEGGKTAYGDAAPINKIARELETKVQNGNTDVILPIISYYGTGRLWAQHRDKMQFSNNKHSSRFDGYVNCLSSKSNEHALINWFKEMTMIELQDREPVPELAAVQDAIATCFRGGDSESTNFRVRYSIRARASRYLMSTNTVNLRFIHFMN